MGDGAGQAGFVQLFLEPVRFKSAGAGDLNGGVADVRDLFQGFREVVQVFGVVSDGVKLCADFHMQILPIFGKWGLTVLHNPILTYLFLRHNSQFEQKTL